MKKNLSPLLYTLVAAVAITWHSCQKSGSLPTPPKTDPLEEQVTASINGRVLDEHNKPVKDAVVRSGGSTTITDINGAFRFSNIQLRKNAGFVQVEKIGYFKGSRTIFTNAGTVNNIEIKLIPKTERGNFQASAGGTITIQNGAAVNFSLNGIIDKASNTVYTGTVKVFGAYLNPEDPGLFSIMPGNLTGLTTGNEQKLLQTYGMIAVELEGSSGEKLNLASGKSATITMPVPSSLQASAPSTIPLWHFNDTLGIWKEEGTASRQGNNYVGTVSHFSFWNCDVPNNFVNLKMTLKNQAGELLSQYRVVLRNTITNSQAQDYTDSSGTVTGAVPPAVPIEMTVYNKCNTLLHTQSIGPFNADTDLGIINITTPAAASITVAGTVLKCNQQPVTNGVVDLLLDGISYRVEVINGSYSATIKRCAGVSSILKVIATDLAANQQSSTSDILVTSGNYTANIQACGISVDQFINYSFGGQTFGFLLPGDSLTGYRNGTTTIINGSGKRINSAADSTNYKYTSFNFTGAQAPGVYNISTGTFIFSKGIPSSVEYTMDGPISITITEYGTPGQFVAGTFTGNTKERYTNAVVTATGSFRVRRY